MCMLCQFNLCCLFLREHFLNTVFGASVGTFLVILVHDMPQPKQLFTDTTMINVCHGSTEGNNLLLFVTTTIDYANKISWEQKVLPTGSSKKS